MESPIPILLSPMAWEGDWTIGLPGRLPFAGNWTGSTLVSTARARTVRASRPGWRFTSNKGFSSVGLLQRRTMALFGFTKNRKTFHNFTKSIDNVVVGNESNGIRY